jgi:hypothetical protein
MFMENPMYYFGQFLGIVAIILGFLTFQMKSREKLVFLQIAATFAFAIHYLLIGAYSGMALNFVAMIRNIVFYFVGKEKPVPRFLSVLFAVFMSVMGVLSWQAWYSIFAVLGLLINSYCMSFSNSQNICKSILVTSPMVLIYNCFVLSVGGIVYESVAIISASIGIFRTRKTV